VERSNREMETTMRRTWTTKNGTKIKIKNMETSHIKNCIRMLERYHGYEEYLGWTAIDGLRGEMAIEAAESAMLSLEENGFEDKADEFIFAFEQELERREEERNDRT
jgi:hypothetical protein